ncbi:hypothetical protein FRX31_020828, partial [Thalictrum thalictroides]
MSRLFRNPITVFVYVKGEITVPTPPLPPPPSGVWKYMPSSLAEIRDVATVAVSLSSVTILAWKTFGDKDPK